MKQAGRTRAACEFSSKLFKCSDIQVPMGPMIGTNMYASIKKVQPGSACLQIMLSSPMERQAHHNSFEGHSLLKEFLGTSDPGFALRSKPGSSPDTSASTGAMCRCSSHLCTYHCVMVKLTNIATNGGAKQPNNATCTNNGDLTYKLQAES